MTATVSGLVAQVKARGVLTAEDALAMRRIAWPDGRIDPDEAAALFDLNAAVDDPCPEWIDVFVEAATEYVVNPQHPRGYVDDAKAAWLIARTDADGRVDTLGELELLVKLLENAVAVPASLRAYALAQIEATVVSGTGPTRGGGRVDPNSITAAEVALLRRMIFAGGGDGPANVSRAEADMLFRIKDATLGQANDAGWRQLFVQGVGNHLMAYGGFSAPPREDAARLDAAMNDTRVFGGGVLGFVRRMGNFREGWRALAADDDRWDDREARVEADRTVTPVERDWLTANIAADGATDPLEAALLAFIAEEQVR